MPSDKKHPAEDLVEARRAIDSLVAKLAKVCEKLRKGTAQASLAKNRLKALRIASSLLRGEIMKRNI